MRRGVIALGAFLALPFVRLVVNNPGLSLPLGRFVVVWALLMAVLVSLLWLLTKRDRDLAARIATALALIAYGFVFLAVALRDATEMTLIGGIDASVWIFAALAIASILISRWKASETFTLWLAVLVLVAVVAEGLNGEVIAKESGEELGSSPQWDVAPTSRPNLYWFILDGYGRADVLEMYYGDDNQEAFLEDLVERGFTVSDEAFSAYPVTYLSVPASLEAEYVAVEGSPVHDRDRYLELMSDGGAVIGAFESWGYEYFLWPGDGWSGTECRGTEDVCLGIPSKLGEVEWALVNMTPLGRLLVDPEAHQRRSDPVSAVEAIEGAEAGHQPFFALIHLMNPHPPHYVAGPSCELQHVPFDLGSPFGRGEYVEAVRCLNTRLLLAVDRIVSQDPRAIVILQGDHGPSWRGDVHEDVSDWTYDDMLVRFAVLSAMRLPEGCTVPERMALVNTFRVVLRCLTGKPVPLLPDRMWITDRVPGNIWEVEPIG